LATEPGLHIPARPEMVLGDGAVASLPGLVEGLGGRAAFVVTDRGLVGAGVAGRVADALRAGGIATELYDGIGANPSLADVAAGAGVLRAFGPAIVVALGGGSPIDAAKGIALGAGAPPIVAVPTTGGTGAETNGFGVIEDRAAGRKVYVGDATTTPRHAILDPGLALSAPPHVTAACGVDALAHAIESLQARTGNAYAAGLALEAVRLIAAHLPGAIRDGGDAEARAAMLLAAHLAALAFATTGLGTAHAIGHALSARHGTAHGVALAAVLPEVVRLNVPARLEQSARIATAAGWPGGAAGLPDAIAAFQDDVGLRPGLSELRVPWGDLDAIAATALEDPVVRNAPRIPSRDELVALLRVAFGRSSASGLGSARPEAHLPAEWPRDGEVVGR
jgi:alcohol dehydrogenase class IV